MQPLRQYTARCSEWGARVVSGESIPFGSREPEFVGRRGRPALGKRGRYSGILLGRQRTDSVRRVAHALAAQEDAPTARSCVVFDSPISRAGLSAQRTNGSCVTVHGRWSSRNVCFPGGPRPPLGAPGDQPPGTYPVRGDRRFAGMRAQDSRALFRVGEADGRTWPE